MFNVKRSFPKLAPRLILSFAVLGTLGGLVDRYWKITFFASNGAENVLFLPRSIYEITVLMIQSIFLLSLVFLAVHWIRQRKQFSALALWWVIVGGSSNMFDRLRFGVVIDYWRLEWFGSTLAYNLADILIVFGTIVLFVCSFSKESILYGSKNS